MKKATKRKPIDVYSEVTDQIIARLENGCVPWVKPWQAEGSACGFTMPQNGVTEHRYSGINILLLWIASFDKGFTDSRYMTYKQARNLGANVIKGETGNRIVIAKDFIPAVEKRLAREEGREARPAFFHKPHTVFNVSQIENLPDSFGDIPHLAPQDLPQTLETVKRNSGVQVRMGGNRAFYSPDLDFIQMPPLEAFPDELDFDRTFYHEMIHATGATHRLERNIRNSKGSKDYAREELVAEMGAAFVCTTLGIESTLQHADYINSWLKVLKEDNTAIFKAASMASKAADLVLSYTQDKQDEEAINKAA